MSREVIEPTVQEAMTEVYAACCAEAGPGQFKRMQVLMKAAVQQHKDSMFQEAAGIALHHSCTAIHLCYVIAVCNAGLQ